MQDDLTYTKAAVADQFDRAFSPGGAWEANRGRQQTRGFAECFVRHVTIPFSAFSLLDVGCALGDAVPVLAAAYPGARLYGCDVSSVAVGRCRAEYGASAEFFTAGFENLADEWDVIYCSNVLEHFPEYDVIARALLRRCRVLYIMTPYYELAKGGRPLSAENPSDHKATFYRHSFDYLVTEGLAVSVAARVVRCTGAWGPSLPKDLLRQVKRGLRMLLTARYHPPLMRQIIFELRRGND